MRDKLRGVKCVLKAKFEQKPQKAGEPGREALAAFGFCKAARVAWLPVSPSRSARAQALRIRRGLFPDQRFEDSLVYFAFCSIVRPND